DLRLAAGEAAATLNALPPRDLAPLYRASGSGGDAGSIERAGLLKAAEGQSAPEARARNIRASLDHARRAGLDWAALAVMAGPTLELRPSPDIGWFSETAIEVALAAGDFEAARKWARLTTPTGTWNPDASS